MRNKELAVIFSRIGDALEIKGETGFKVVAYRKAACILEDLTENIEDLKRVIENGSLARLSGLGGKKVENIKKGIKIYEHVRRDTCLI